MPKFTAKMFRNTCQCARQCVCVTEIDALNAMVDAFAVEMKAKLKEKYLEGWDGWDDPRARQYFMNSIQNKSSKYGQEVDIANFAAMLWNLED